MKNGIPASVVPLLDVWRAPQQDMDEVRRWGKYIDKEEGVRVQNTLQHTCSISFLGVMAVPQFYRYLPPGFNFHLFLSAITIHDFPEGERKKVQKTTKDVLYIDKTDERDLEEYLFFLARHERAVDAPVFDFLHRAYLLQYALKNPECFPERARELMAHIIRENRLEAVMFGAMEYWDYLLYALEQYHERGNEMILTQVLRNVTPHFERLSKQLPGFKEVVWTGELSGWCRDFGAAHEGMWIEQRGEV